MTSKAKQPVESYGGGGREDHGGGEAGRGAHGSDPADQALKLTGSAGGGASGASSAIGNGEKRRAASGATGSVSVEAEDSTDCGADAAERSA